MSRDQADEDGLANVMTRESKNKSVAASNYLAPIALGGSISALTKDNLIKVSDEGARNYFNQPNKTGQDAYRDRGVEKQYADIRVKMGNKRSPGKYEVDNESLPSDMGDDLWGEIPKFQHQRYLQDLKKQKVDKIAKKNMIRQTLDKQMEERKGFIQKQQ